MKTAQEILNSCIINNFDDIDNNTFIKAMKIYANQQLSLASEVALDYDKETISEKILNLQDEVSI